MCKTNKHIAFLLGAGFSVPAELPTANTLNQIITSEIFRRIRLSFKDRHDGVLESFILEKVLLDCDECGDFNYELYFDFLEREKKEYLDKDKLLSFIEKGMYGYFWKCSYKNDTKLEANTAQIKNMFDSIIKKCGGYSVVVESIVNQYQHYIAKSVSGNSENGKIIGVDFRYQNFIDALLNSVKQGYIIDIYTLNHDLLLESLLSHNKELRNKVCNGFGEKIGKIRGKEYKVFDINHFDKEIRIYKLHGSIDIHELSFLDGREKQYIQIIDGYSNRNAFLMTDSSFASILPLFLTGKTSKEKKYEKEPFKSMMDDFRNNIRDAEKLIVIGYSGNDSGINDILFDNYMHWNRACVVSPNAKEHPFVMEQNAKAIEKGIEELTIDDLFVASE